MTSRLFFFGRTPELSFVELQVFAPAAILVADKVARVDGDILVDGHIASDDVLIHLLGGTVKIASYEETVTELQATRLTQLVRKTNDKTKIVFGLSGYGIPSARIKKLVVDMKDLFVSSNISARFVLPREGSEVSLVAIEKEHIDELVIIARGEDYVIGKTTCVQLFEEWSSRDYSRPYADPKTGMLPPKVAKMAVNIALGADSRGKTLLDPFCGMGTILGEALLRGVNTLGSDINADTIVKVKKNISWLIQRFDSKANARLFVSDAVHVADEIGIVRIDAIVTEPFMGTTKIGEGKVTDSEKIQHIVKGLDKLYIGCLKNWAMILKSGGTIMMAIPSFLVEGRVYSVKKVVDTCENLGYTKQLGPITYGRPHAVVHRNFFVFKKI